MRHFGTSSAGLLSVLLVHITIVTSLAFNLHLPPSTGTKPALLPRRGRLSVSTSEETTCSDSCDRSYVDIAAHYLVPVLFDDHDDKSGKVNTIEAEKALKRCLRQCERVWRGDIDSNAASDATAIARLMVNLPSSNQYERQTSRKRLSDLILGTSVMRLRHWYVLNQQASLFVGVEPIVGVESWMVAATDEDSATQENSIGARAGAGATRELVRLHTQYLLSTNTTGDAIQWPTDPIQRVAIQQSLPLFIVRIFSEQYGASEAEILSQLANRPGPITLRRNAIRCESDEMLIQRLREEDGIKSFVPGATSSSDALSIPLPSGCIRLEYDGGSSASDRPSKSLWSLQAWKNGWFEVQDVGSQFIVDSVDVQHSDDTAVDFCAGNGGKTLALASRMWEVRQRAGENSQAGTIIAHDIVGNRLKQIEGSLARTGLRGGELHDDIPSNHIPKIRTTSDATSIGREVADAVLVDAPCSSLGVLRRRPGHRWALTEDMVTREFPSLQLDILTRASQLVKPGGKLVYATCSVSQFENEGVVDMFESREDFGGEWLAWEFEDVGSHFRSILPHVDGCDGFFIARWKRRNRIR